MSLPSQNSVQTSVTGGPRPNLVGVRNADDRPAAIRSAAVREWEVNDRAWRGVQRVIERLDPPPLTGRPRHDARRTLNGILFRERTGCQWRSIPDAYGDDATIHRAYRRWVALGVMDKIREVLAEAGRLADDEPEELAIPIRRRTPRGRAKSRGRGG